MAVVKANAYGHGMCEIAKQAISSGAAYLSVARIDEAVELRSAGIKAPILVLGYTPADDADLLVANGLTATVYALKDAADYSQKAHAQNATIPIHLKVDTGMGRYGMMPKTAGVLTPSAATDRDAIQQVIQMTKLPGVRLEGILTHFAASDSREKTYSNQQLTLFLDFISKLEQAGVSIPIKHAANSGAIIDMPEAHLDMVRGGISMYGYYPSDEVDKARVDLKPAMTLKARIVQLKKVPAGFHVSYGMTHQTEAPTTIATVPVGYADGYSRLLSSRGQMLVRGRRAPVVGRVCMDSTMLDVGHIPEVHVGDEVVVFGQQGEAVITVDELAASLNTINYEVVSGIMKRVPRIYYR
jgi:alanine racemase